jgi:hypothetical protein
MAPEQWNEVRAKRHLRADVPIEDLDECKTKAQRIGAAFATLRRNLQEARPDVIVVFGDDQLETLDWNNNPAFAVFAGEAFEGESSTRDLKQALSFTEPADNGEGPAPRIRLQAHPELAASLMTGLMRRGFDPAFCMDAPKPEVGIGHAFLRPAESLTDLQTPVVPVLVNCFFAPQPTAYRCYQLGKAMGEIIEEHPGDLRVAVIGSGGLWHTPGTPDAYLDEEFDRESVSYLERGDVEGAARFFDAYEVPEGDTSQDVWKRGPLSTGMPVSGGPQLGTREFCNWVASNAVLDGRPATLVDYVPVYASPCGMGFMYTNPG